MQISQEPVTISKEVAPHRDFFTVQFLLGLWQSGITTVSVETSIVDFDGRNWMTGPKATLSVRVYEDSTAVSKSQSSTTGARHGTTLSSPGVSGIPPQLGISTKPRI